MDANTAKAKAWLSRTGAPLVFTALHVLEVRNAFQLGVFRGFFSAADAAATWVNVETDLRSGRLIKTAVNWPVAFRLAARLTRLRGFAARKKISVRASVWNRTGEVMEIGRIVL